MAPSPPSLDSPGPPTDPDRPTESPRRAHTILGRLSHAVREQNWFAVALEVCIVIVGVVIGFQVTAWGQARADADREASYLVLLSEDLRETLRRVEQADAGSARFLRSEVMLLRAYRMPVPPPDDSVLTWLAQSFNEDRTAPVTATVEALVATGDLALIRNDSLRRAIPAYLGQTRTTQAAVDLYTAEHMRAVQDATRLFDIWDIVGEVMAAPLPQAVIDSLSANDDTFGLPPGPRTRPFPVSADEVLGDERIYNAVMYAHITQYNLLEHRTDMREHAERLLALLGDDTGAAADTTSRRP